MTVEAGPLDLFNGIAFRSVNPPVADHARFVVLGKRRQFFFSLMAGSTLFMPRFGGVKGYLFLDRSLFMRVVAGQAHFVLFSLLDPLGTVLSFLQIDRHLFVANQAMVGLKEILGPFPYFFRVRMKRFFLSVVMAVPARCLSMDRGMEFLGIDPPGGLGRGREQQ